MKETQTNQNPINLEITRDGLPTDEFQPELHTVVLNSIKERIGIAASNVALEMRMGLYDTFHSTNYRTIRRELVEEKRRERFERSIGLISLK